MKSHSQKYKNWPLYPKITMSVGMRTSDMAHIYSCTLLRKKHRGKWYFWPVSYSWEGSKETLSEAKDYVWRVMMSNIYMAQLFGKVDPKLKDHAGEKIFEKDSYQISEFERMTVLDHKTKIE